MHLKVRHNTVKVISFWTLSDVCRRLTSSGWLISNKSSLLSFHCLMTLANFSLFSSSGIFPLIKLKVSVRLAAADFRFLWQKSSYLPYCCICKDLHPVFNLFPISYELIVLRSEFLNIIAYFIPTSTSPLQAPRIPLPSFNGSVDLCYVRQTVS